MAVHATRQKGWAGQAGNAGQAWRVVGARQQGVGASECKAGRPGQGTVEWEERADVWRLSRRRP